MPLRSPLKTILLYLTALTLWGVGMLAILIADSDYHSRAAALALDHAGYNGERRLQYIVWRSYCPWWRASVTFLVHSRTDDDPNAVGGDVVGFVCTDHFGNTSIHETKPGQLVSSDEPDWEPRD